MGVEVCRYDHDSLLFGPGDVKAGWYRSLVVQLGGALRPQLSSRRVRSSSRSRCDHSGRGWLCSWRKETRRGRKKSGQRGMRALALMSARGGR